MAGRQALRSAGRLLLASHPGPAAGVTALAAAYAVAVGHRPRRAALLGLTVLSGQLAVGWHNDWLDAERDAAAGRRDKPVARGMVSRQQVRNAALVALGAAVPLSLACGRAAGRAHLAALASALAYNGRLKATPLSPLPFLVSFGLLPNVITAAAPGRRPAPWWATAAASLLGAGAHLLNALPDLEADEQAGVRGLPHRLGRSTSLSLACGLLGAASALLALAPDGLAQARLRTVAPALVPSGALVAAIASSARAPASRRPFELAIVLALTDVALLLGRSRRPQAGIALAPGGAPGE